MLRAETNTNVLLENFTKDDVIQALSATDTTELEALIKAGLDWNYQVCHCNSSECLRQSLLQCLVIPKNYGAIKKLYELHPQSPVNLTLTTNKFGHSIAYCLAKRNDFQFLHALIKDSSEVKINITEKHGGNTLLELLVEKSEWRLIIELLLINLNSKQPHFIPITKTINKCKDDVLAIIHKTNKIVQDTKKLAMNKSEIIKKQKELTLIESDIMNIQNELNITESVLRAKFAEDIKDSEDKFMPPANEQAVNENKTLEQLFKGKVTYTLTTQEKSVTLRLQDDHRQHAKSLAILKNLFKQLANCEIKCADNSIEINIKNMQILDSFLHAKFALIMDIFNPKAEVSHADTFFDSLVQDEQPKKVHLKSKPKPNKTEAIAQQIKESRTQREQKKDREKQKRQTTRQSTKIAQQSLTDSKPVEDGVTGQKEETINKNSISTSNINSNSNYRVGIFSNEPILPPSTEVPKEATALEYYTNSRIFGYMRRK